jgi:choice-of-anchor B domain-containing protein
MKKLLFSGIYFLTLFSASSQSCQDNEVVLQLNTGDWASEVSWSITDSLGNLIDSTSQTYADSTTYYDTICLINGCYNFNMFDTYGDGWQGGSYQLSDSLGNIVSSGNLQGSFSFGSNMFSINSTSCPVLGCTLPSAVNYNPIATVDDSSCQIISDNINLLFNWSDSILPINSLGGSYTDVYGVAINGGEYAVIGSTMGAHIIDVTNPSQSYEAAFVPGAFQGSLVTHRDYFHMDNYLYAVCDQGSSTLQIIDLSNLPNSVTIIYDTDSLISTTHNIFIDTLNKKLYTTSGKVFDISDPINPSFLFHMGFFYHDLYVENDTGYFNCFSNGLQIYEMTTNSPQYLGSLTSYPDQGTNHSGWKKDSIYIMADENGGLSLKVIDVSDLNNLQVIALFNSGVLPSPAVPHNLIIRDNFVYVSYYCDGLQVFDISNPNNPIKAGYYDTYPSIYCSGFKGNWGVDPQLPSGIILVSDVQSGLFILEFDYNEESICDGDSLLFDTSYVNVDGFHISNTIDSLGYPDIIVTELSTIPITSSTQSFSICNGDSLVVGSNVYTSSGNYTDTLSAFTSCDSIIYTSLLVSNSSYAFDTLVASVSVIWNGVQLSVSGDYSIVLINSAGCDSIVNLNFTYNHISAINNNNTKERTLIKITDVLGRETNGRENKLLLYLFDDGIVEKKIILE